MYGPAAGAAPDDRRRCFVLPVGQRDVAVRARDGSTKIGRSGPRPLATTTRSSPKTGVGAVIFELPPSRHSSFPVRGS